MLKLMMITLRMQNLWLLLHFSKGVVIIYQYPGEGAMEFSDFGALKSCLPLPSTSAHQKPAPSQSLLVMVHSGRARRSKKFIGDVYILANF